MRGKVLNSQ